MTANGTRLGLVNNQLKIKYMETNLEKAKRLIKDNALISGVELPNDGFIMQMLELAATPDKLNQTEVIKSVCQCCGKQTIDYFNTKCSSCGTEHAFKQTVL